MVGQWDWVHFLWGCVGAAAPEILHLWTAARHRREDLPKVDIIYVAALLAFAGLGGAVAVLWGENEPFKCFWVGLSLPAIITTFASQIPTGGPAPQLQNMPTGGSAALDFAVLSAFYGAGAVRKDVSAEVKRLMRNGSLKFQVGNELFGGDPIPGTAKSLTLTFLHGGGGAYGDIHRRYGRISSLKSEAHFCF